MCRKFSLSDKKKNPLAIHSLTRSLKFTGKKHFRDGKHRHTDTRLTDIATERLKIIYIKKNIYIYIYIYFCQHLFQIRALSDYISVRLHLCQTTSLSDCISVRRHICQTTALSEYSLSDHRFFKVEKVTKW